MNNVGYNQNQENPLCQCQGPKPSAERQGFLDNNTAVPIRSHYNPLIVM